MLKIANKYPPLDDNSIKNVLNAIANMHGVIYAQRGGSTIICGTDPNKTDVDINVLCTSFGAFNTWERCVDYPSAQDEDLEDFAAFRRGPINVLAFKNRAEFEAVLWCTRFAQKWSMPNKEQRYEFFEYVRKIARNQL
jgi:hypothetical protein